MKRLAIAALAVSLVSCSFIRGNVPRPDLGTAIDAAAASVEIKQKYDDCKAFSEKPISYPEEVAIGGAIALALGAKSQGGVFVEVSPEIASLSSIPKGKYDKQKPAPGTGPKTDLTKYLNLLGKGLASFSDRPTIEWVFVVLDSPTPNAFSAPGGYVFVTTGMLKQVQNEAQLAGIIGHEIGHVTGKHALEAYKKSKLVSCLSAYFGEKASDGAVRSVLGPLADDVGRIPFAGDVLASLKLPVFDPNKLSGPFVKWLTNKIVEWLSADGYGDMEKGADAIGTKVLAFSGYDIAEYEKVIAGLPEGVGAIKHPSNKERLATIAEAKKDVADFSGAGKAPALSPTVAAAVK